MSDSVTMIVRDVTDDEVEFFDTNGWVKLDRLIDPDTARSMRQVAEPLVRANQMADTHTTADASSDIVGAGPLPALAGRHEPLLTFALSTVMGRNAQRLMRRASRLAGRELPVRVYNDAVMCKPAGSGTTRFHQDSTETGADRIGKLNLWVALDEVTPEMGSMRFLTGVHREGPLGSVFSDPDPSLRASDIEELGRIDPGVLGLFPGLLEMYRLSPPISYQPGDATVHDGFMIHGSPPNTTDRDRWAFLISYAAAGVKFLRDGDNVSGEFRTPDDARCPVVFGA